MLWGLVSNITCRTDVLTIARGVSHLRRRMEKFLSETANVGRIYRTVPSRCGQLEGRMDPVSITGLKRLYLHLAHVSHFTSVQDSPVVGRHVHIALRGCIASPSGAASYDKQDCCDAVCAQHCAGSRKEHTDMNQAFQGHARGYFTSRAGAIAALEACRPAQALRQAFVASFIKLISYTLTILIHEDRLPSNHAIWSLSTMLASSLFCSRVQRQLEYRCEAWLACSDARGVQRPVRTAEFAEVSHSLSSLPACLYRSSFHWSSLAGLDH
jgi:hypothetical protein